MQTETTQRTIFGEPLEETLYLETTGRTIRPFKRVIDQVADEYRIAFTEDTVTVDVVDSANVQMLRLSLDADAFDTYDVDGEITLGINSNAFGSALQHARYGKSTDDSLTLSADAEHLQTKTTREIGDTDATINERVALLDPDSIRQKPEIPDLDFDVTVDIDPRAFCEVVGMLDDDNTAMRIGSNPDSIVFNQDSDLAKRNIRLDADPDAVAEWTHYSVDYMKDWAAAFRNGYVDDLTLKWTEEYPLLAEFSRGDVMHGEILVAPRIQSD